MHVGGYRFVDRLAVGGMAEVFVAVAVGAEGFEKPVVLKRLLPELAQHPRFHQMFLDEARIMLNLQHGNIVQILDMGRIDGIPFLALEYVDGRDLRTVLRRLADSGATMPHGLTAYIASEVCRALDYAHRKTDEEGRPLHVVHRDLNPANIFLSHEGVVKVGDFGLAKARDNLDQSEAGIIKGKFAYLSPEQANGQPIDHRSDIFSLGTTLYEMTCGRRPFEAQTDMEVVIKVREARFEPPSSVVPGFNPELEAIILRALRRDPAERYPTAGQAREDLVRYLQGLPAPPGDRELTEFLNSLFGAERRSQSALFRLAPLLTLPPAVTSVSRAGGLSEFQRSATPSPVSAVGFTTAPGIAVTAEVRLPASSPAARPPEQRGLSAGTWIVLGVLGLALAGAAGILVYTLFSPAEGTATLQLTSVPSGAAVLLDGADTGQRTPAVLHNMVVGKEYGITLRRPLAADVHRRFRIDRPGMHAHRFELELLRETLTVESEPPASDVHVDGELRGQTPLRLQLPRGGKYAITLSATGHKEKQVLHYAEREHDRLLIRLEPLPAPPAPKARPGRPRGPAPPKGGAPGTLEIETAAAGNVFIDDRLVGRTPNFRISLPSRTYSVVVVPDGTKIRHAASITIVERQTHRVRLTGTPPP